MQQFCAYLLLLKMYMPLQPVRKEFMVWWMKSPDSWGAWILITRVTFEAGSIDFLSLPCETAKIIDGVEVVNEQKWKPSMISEYLRYLIYSWFHNVSLHSQLSGYDPQLARWDVDQRWLSMADDLCGKKRAAMNLREFIKQTFERFNQPTHIRLFTSFVHLFILYKPRVVTLWQDLRLSQLASNDNDIQHKPKRQPWILVAGICTRQSCLSSFSCCAGVQPFVVKQGNDDLGSCFIVHLDNMKLPFAMHLTSVLFVHMVKVLFAQAECSDVCSSFA